MPAPTNELASNCLSVSVVRDSIWISRPYELKCRSLRVIPPRELWPSPLVAVEMPLSKTLLQLLQVTFHNTEEFLKMEHLGTMLFACIAWKSLVGGGRFYWKGETCSLIFFKKEHRLGF